MQVISVHKSSLIVQCRQFQTTQLYFWEWWISDMVPIKLQKTLQIRKCMAMERRKLQKPNYTASSFDWPNQNFIPTKAIKISECDVEGDELFAPKKKFRNKSLNQHGSSYACYVHSEDFSLLRFTLHQYILRYGDYLVVQKINVIPYPSTLNCK